MYRVPFKRLKANKKCTPDVFLGSTDLREVSLIHLICQKNGKNNKLKVNQATSKELILL